VRAFCLSLSASSSRRSPNAIVCVKRFLCIAVLPILWGGSAISVLMTDETIGQCDHGDSVRPHRVRPKLVKALQQKLSIGGKEADSFSGPRKGYGPFYLAVTTKIGTTVRCGCLWPTNP
jgi:hypothetical protein